MRIRATALPRSAETGFPWIPLAARLLCSVLVGSALAVVAAAHPSHGAVAERCLPETLPIGQGAEHSVFLDETGQVWASGLNWAGQFGNGTTSWDPGPNPEQALIPADVIAVYGGGSHTLAMRSDGSLWAWGYNISGQLGDGTSGSGASKTTPIEVQGLPGDVVQVSAGGNHNLALTGDGTVWAWGDGRFGQLGNGTWSSSPVPVQVSGLTDVVQVEAGGWASYALKSDGTVWVWGDNLHGALGLGDEIDRNVPVKNNSLSGVEQVSGGYDYAHALLTSGSVKGWGENFWGQIGDGGPNTERLTPVTVTGLSSVTHIGHGGNHTLAVRSDGTVWTWGINGAGQLGNGTTTDAKVPVQAHNITNAKAVIGGANWLSAALGADGRMWVWGENIDGELGTGTTTNVLKPWRRPDFKQVLPDAPSNVEAVAGEELAYLTWDAPEQVVTQYVVTPHIDGVAQAEVTAGTEPSFPVGGLTEGTTYSFKVKAQNCRGTGADSTVTNRVVPTGVQLNSENFTVEGERLNDRHVLRVNTFNGDLSVQATDFQIAGTGIDLVISRTYHSRSDESSILGNQWSVSGGVDVSLEFLADDSIFFHGPGGLTTGFAKNSGGGYETPAGLDADLDHDDGGTPLVTTDDLYTITFRGSGEKLIFDDAGRLTHREDRNDNAISYAYDLSGLLTSITDTQSRAVSFAYDTDGRVTSITDSTGRTSSYQYDAPGNLTRATDPEGGKTSYDYDYDADHSVWKLTKITTPGGRVIEISYDTSRRVTSVTFPFASGSPTTTFAYSGDQTVVTDANGNDTTYRYDPVGRTTAAIDANGNSTDIEYTSKSNVEQYSVGSSGAFSFGYDSVHNLTSAALPTGAKSILEYSDPDHPHLPSTITDPQNNDLDYTYDANGNLLTQTDELAVDNEVEFTYNTGDGTLATSEDAMGTTTTYGYTGGNLTSVTPPSPLGSLSLSYDALSRVTAVTDGKGQTTSFVYDGLDRVTEIVYADGTSVERVFDPDGNVVSMTDRSGTTTMQYDQRNRLVQRETPDGEQVTYTYDMVGNVRSVADSGGTVTYGYDAVNLPVSVTEPDGDTTSYTYDAAYNRTSAAFPNGLATTYTFDDANRLIRQVSTLAGDTLADVSYEYTPLSGVNPDSLLRHKVTDHVEQKRTFFHYDELNRLKKARTERLDATGWLIEYRYQYDGNSNRIRVDIDTPDDPPDFLELYEYNAADQLIEFNDTETFAYDDNGNLISSNLGWELDYDAADRTTATRPRGDKGIRTEFLYRGPGQAERYSAGPIAQRVSTGGPICVGTCLNDPDAEVTMVTYTHTALGLASETVANTTTSFFTRDPSGHLVSQRTPVGDHYFVTDGIGSITAVTDTNGLVVAEYDYDPFGKLTEATGLTTVTPFRFAGYYLDATGLYKAGERYYDPAFGRWTQHDPIHSLLDPKLWNRYVYVGNDPVNYTDPSGLNAFSDFVCRNEWFDKTINALSILPRGYDVAGLTGTAGTANVAVVSGLVAHAGKTRGLAGTIAKGFSRLSGVVTGGASLVDLGRRVFC